MILNLNFSSQFACSLGLVFVLLSSSFIAVESGIFDKWHEKFIYSHRETLDLHDAMEFCKEFGGHLPLLDSAEKIESFTNLAHDLGISTHPVWLANDNSSYLYDRDFWGKQTNCSNLALRHSELIRTACSFKLNVVCVLPEVLFTSIADWMSAKALVEPFDFSRLVDERDQQMLLNFVYSHTIGSYHVFVDNYINHLQMQMEDLNRQCQISFWLSISSFAFLALLFLLQICKCTKGSSRGKFTRLPNPPPPLIHSETSHVRSVYSSPENKASDEGNQVCH